ncbi:hypothetical protein AK812_SmicGene37435 [Symbiodinium microadriaticum]|uniref:Reverse transcriptase domain-containing protein n=1 Tax=Symbiodinium microadriaticum TaxID=2951 RepID=A0A1Q9CG85_SYMMI|nr:hypothetical protein AK812_SmicGene37435 [Symbiodinium microadriaticum]
MMLQNTFTADSIFLPVRLSASAVMTQMEQAVPEHILNAFPFRFSSRKSRVSWAYILPKFKKDWKAGRPIVSFSAHPARQFLVIMAKVTEMLVAEVCPHARPYNDAILLWQAIHQLFGRTDSQSPPAPDPLILHNQDLSGFFVSIPAERFMITFRLLLTKFYGCADEDLENTLHHATITVDLANDLSVMKTIRGRHCLVHDKHVAVPMRLFLEAVRVSFKFTLFTVGGQTIQQLRGAPMGSHFSPAACHAVVSLYEHMYFGHCLLQSAQMPTFGLVVRYVDNRLALLHQSCDQQSVVRAFLHPDVYIPPIILEYEEGNIFLGFDIDPVARTISYVQPDVSWKFLHRRSAANTRTLLSSFAEATLDQGWRSLILGPRLDQLLAASRAILLQISVFVSEDRRRLTRVYQAFHQHTPCAPAGPLPPVNLPSLAASARPPVTPAAVQAFQFVRVAGVARLMYLSKRKKRQRPPLTAEMVVALEKLTCNAEAPALDRVIAGFFVLLVFSRGYVEADVARTKAAYTLERKTMFLPIVAPRNGLSGRDWFAGFAAAREASGVPTGPGLPLLPARTTSSGWATVPPKAGVAASWLRGVLQGLGFAMKDVAPLGTHSCKATALSWTAKFGLDASTRRTLGYHSSKEDRMTHVYSRDAIAAPVRELQRVLTEIREKRVKPDETRSGYFRTEQELQESDTESSCDEEDDGEDQGALDDAVEACVQPWAEVLGAGDDGTPVARHKVSRTIHAIADEVLPVKWLVAAGVKQGCPIAERLMLSL